MKHGFPLSPWAWSSWELKTRKVVKTWPNHLTWKCKKKLTWLTCVWNITASAWEPLCSYMFTCEELPSIDGLQHCKTYKTKYAWKVGYGKPRETRTNMNQQLGITNPSKHKHPHHFWKVCKQLQPILSMSCGVDVSSVGCPSSSSGSLHSFELVANSH